MAALGTVAAFSFSFVPHHPVHLAFRQQSHLTSAEPCAFEPNYVASNPNFLGFYRLKLLDQQVSLEK